MRKVRITVMRRACYPDLMEKYENPIEHPCGIEEAVSKAIEKMPKDFVIKAFLETHKAEVKGMLLTEYNEAETMELFKEDGRAEGRAEGRIAAIVHNVRALLAETDWSVDKALDVLHVSPEDRSIVVAQL